MQSAIRIRDYKLSNGEFTHSGKLKIYVSRYHSKANVAVLLGIHERTLKNANKHRVDHISKILTHPGSMHNTFRGATCS